MVSLPPCALNLHLMAQFHCTIDQGFQHAFALEAILRPRFSLRGTNLFQAPATKYRAFNICFLVYELSAASCSIIFNASLAASLIGWATPPSLRPQTIAHLRLKLRPAKSLAVVALISTSTAVYMGKNASSAQDCACCKPHGRRTWTLTGFLGSDPGILHARSVWRTCRSAFFRAV
jgi:hypothetical protein